MTQAIDAVEIFKDCTKVSDENALKGLPMLLDGFAASWFQGVKSSLKTWEEAVNLLRTTFGPCKPPYRVYRELFAEEQSADIKTDVFICKCRAILAQLPDKTLSEETMLDMVYGLLNVKIRKRVPRDNLQTFNDLLTQARLAEETSSSSDKNRDMDKSNKKPRCGFCKNLGHLKDQCHKLAAKQVKPTEGNSDKKDIAVTGSDSRKSVVATTSASPSLPALACYGCGLPGYIRSNCPKCKMTTTSTFDFSSADVKQNKSENMDTVVKLSPHARPILNIGILGFDGTALVDTGAKQSIAGYTLYKIFQDTGQPLVSENITIKLADGTMNNRDVLLAKTDVHLQGRVIPTTFVILPNAKNNTLLGIDFITDAKININVPDATWNFIDDAGKMNPSVEVIASSFETLRPEEGQTLTAEQRGIISL
ncbi:hypothetical protein NQ318_004410 [Aromia moschata]|uniref:CCHC-type domain-containing protein n=1 Tax=Aromia moschata TaxID=1265417 RepID=A0AAV8Y5B3_9CUCU|nr:hypothetical protein NQ318_004410 [Aromia moschata]